MEVFFYHYYLFYIVIQQIASYLVLFFETYTKEKLYMYMYIFNVIFS